MMQKEEILILSCPTVKLSVTIPALYRLCATDAAMRLDRVLKSVRQGQRRTVRFHFESLSGPTFFIPDRAAVDFQCSKRILRKAAYPALKCETSGNSEQAARVELFSSLRSS